MKKDEILRQIWYISHELLKSILKPGIILSEFTKRSFGKEFWKVIVITKTGINFERLNSSNSITHDRKFQWIVRIFVGEFCNILIYILFAYLSPTSEGFLD